MKWPTWLKLSLGLLAAAIVGFAAWSAASFDTAVETKNAFTDIRDMPSPLVGQQAPAFALEGVTGERIDLAAYQGKTLLISFWSSF